ncbi:MAG TPA: DUF2232 domain-containing protein [Magnetospirillum sp.]|nr:DUF2232 domain-containing protein [Magnetospirillum sp.]
MNRQLGLALAAGLLSALMFLSLVKGIALGAVLSYAAPLPLIMAGLGLGMGAMVTAGAVAAVAVAAVAGGFSALPFAVAAALPALVVTNRALLRREADNGPVEWYPPGLVLAWLTAAGLALMLCGMAFLIGSPDGIEGSVSKVLGHALDMMAASVPAEQRAQAVKWWTPLFPAMVIGSWLMMAVINATGAQGLLVRLGQARRPSPAYRELWLPDWPAIGLVAAAVAAILVGGDVGYVATNVVAVLLIPFVFLGLAAIHRWAKGRPNAGYLLAALYGLLILAFGWAAVAVAGLGLVRFWTMRFRRPDSGGGMEG